VTRTVPAATCELDELDTVLVVVVVVVVLTVVVLVESVVDPAVVAVVVDGGGSTATVPAVAVVPEVPEVVEVVEVVGGAQVALWSGLPFGGGSLGLPAPCGWKRQPSTMSAWTREPPGPTLEYSHDPDPCQ